MTGIERVWLLSRVAKSGGPNEPRRMVEGVALSEEDARMWKSESGEYEHQAEQVPVWRPATMMVSGDVDLDDPEMAEAMEDIRQAGLNRLAKPSIDSAALVEQDERLRRAESALRHHGYRESCDIPACNCGDQWMHGGHAEARLSEIREKLDDLRDSAEWGNAVALIVGPMLDWFEGGGREARMPGALLRWLEDLSNATEHLEIDAEERQWLLRRDILTEFEQAIFKTDLVVGDDKLARLNALKARLLGGRP